jgi:hypothetical protein
MTNNILRQFLIIVIIACSSLLTPQARSAPIFYTDEVSWLAAITGLETFDTTASNILTANEVSSLPGANEQLGVDLLTFESVNTGLSLKFSVETERPGSRWTFDDHENGGNIPIFDNALSPGDLNDEFNDNLEFIFSGIGISAFGFDLRNNDDNDSEHFDIYGVGNLLLASFSPIPINAGSQFLGVVSSEDIYRIVFDEDNGGDDIAIANFQFGQAAVVPEPSTFALIITSFIGLSFINKRRKKAANVA